MTPTPHGQVPEALIDLIDAYAETRHRCGGIYNARTEAARKAVIEALSGMQALSAAPPALPPYPPLPMQFACSGVFAVYSADQMRAYVDADRAARAPADSVAAPAIRDELRDTLVAVSAAIAERDDRAAQKMIGEILAASPTPPAEARRRYDAAMEQAAPKAAPTRTALPEGWTDCTIEFGNDGPEVVAYGPKRMMTRLAKWLGKYFAQVIAEAAPKAAPGEQNTVPAEWLEQAYREGWAACRDAETIGEEAEDWAFGNSTANSRMIDAQQAAPKQEVQEPHGWLYEWTHSSATGKPDSTYTAFTTDEAHARKHDNCRAIYTAPQPAPATQQAGDVVAYLDVGASGYLDLGAALSEDALQQLPKGRHALVIAGTYGIDGYVAAPQPSPTTKPAPQQEAQEPTEIPEEIERMAADRYKVVPGRSRPCSTPSQPST